MFYLVLILVAVIAWVGWRMITNPGTAELNIRSSEGSSTTYELHSTPRQKAKTLQDESRANRRS